MLGAAADAARASSSSTSTRARSRATTTSRWSRAASRARRAGAGARPLAVPDRRRVRLAALRLRRRSCTPRCARSRSAAAACCSTCARRGAASGSRTSSRPTRSRTAGLDTVEANVKLGLPADLRDYGIGAQILVRPRRARDRAAHQQSAQDGRARGARAHASCSRVPIRIAADRHNRRYLATKRDKLGHLLDLKLGET